MTNLMEICANNNQIRTALREYAKKKELMYKATLNRTGNTQYQGAIYAMQIIQHELDSTEPKTEEKQNAKSN